MGDGLSHRLLLWGKRWRERVSSAGICASPTSHSQFVVLKLETTKTERTHQQQESEANRILFCEHPLLHLFLLHIPCFKVHVGALLSEHDVLSSKSCSHLPRHIHEHTQHTHSCSSFHLSSLGQRSLWGSASPPCFLFFCFLQPPRSF